MKKKRRNEGLASGGRACKDADIGPIIEDERPRYYAVARMIAPTSLFETRAPFPKLTVVTNPGDAIGYMPVFRTRAEAQARYGADVPCIEITVEKKS